MKQIAVLEVLAEKDGVSIGFGSFLAEKVGDEVIDEIFDEEFLTELGKRSSKLMSILAKKIKEENKEMSKKIGISDEDMETLTKILMKSIKKVMED